MKSIPKRDPAYEKARNELVPYAYLEARARVAQLGKQSEVRPGVDGKPYTWSFLEQFFHEEMTRMVKEAGI